MRLLNKLSKIINKILKKIRRAIFGILKLDKVTGYKIHNPGYKLESLGTEYGGWNIPVELIDSYSICYSIGAGEDISFDCELASKFNCEVYIFDPTPRAIIHFNQLIELTNKGEKMNINNQENITYNINKKDLKYLHYFDYGIWSKSGTQKFFAPKKRAYVSHSIVNTQNTEEYFEAECRTLSDMMKELNHKKIDLLKIDVEGAEYEIIDSMINNNIDVRILCLEFDEIDFDDRKSYLKIKKTTKKLLENGYDLILASDSDYTFIKK